MSINVWEFDGTAKIANLSAFPLEYHPSLKKTKRKLIQRGKTFEALSGYHYKLYQGIAIGQGPWGPIKYNVDSRIIIDTYAWNRFNPNRQVALNALTSPAKKRSRVLEKEDYDEEDDEDEYYDEEYEDEDEDEDKDVPATGAKHKSTNLTHEQLLICSSSLKGYSLRNKKWLTFSIDSVKDIKFSEAAFGTSICHFIATRIPSSNRKHARRICSIPRLPPVESIC